MGIIYAHSVHTRTHSCTLLRFQLMGKTWRLIQHHIGLLCSQTRATQTHAPKTPACLLACLLVCTELRHQHRLPRIAGKRGSLSHHRTTGGLLVSPTLCIAGMSAPSRTIQRHNPHKRYAYSAKEWEYASFPGI